MNSSSFLKTRRRIADAIHGTIELTDLECRVIDTATFQRLRHLKQLGLAHVTYPNATHTRFAHSLGVLHIMSQVLRTAAEALGLDNQQQQDLRLAALLHDVGHYPYSHLLERIDQVVLTEERLASLSKHDLRLAESERYPDHEEFGRLIVTSQPDICTAIGGGERAIRVADLFTRTGAANPQLSKLIHSTLDMDRLDYVVRDARAAGVPYGEVDIDYLLHNVRSSQNGMIGIDFKGLTAAEQFLFSRYFMYRAVYFHKTTFGLEEVLRQLLRRCRDSGKYGVPRDGYVIREMATDGAKLHAFTDHFVDSIARNASTDSDPIISRLAGAVVNRRPPKLLREECALIDEASDAKHNACTWFVSRCRNGLADLSRQFGVPVQCFLLAEPGVLRLEKRGPMIPAAQAKELPEETTDELIKVFEPGESEPKSLVDIRQSIVASVAHLTCRMTRLYVLWHDEGTVAKLQKAVSDWRNGD